MLDASRPECGRPFAIAELLSVDVAASRGREEERCIQTRRQPSECLDDAPAQAHAPSLAVGFRSSRPIATAYSSSRHWSSPKRPQRYGPFAARWLCLYLEEHEK